MSRTQSARLLFLLNLAGVTLAWGAGQNSASGQARHEAWARQVSGPAVHRVVHGSLPPINRQYCEDAIRPLPATPPAARPPADTPSKPPTEANPMGGDPMADPTPSGQDVLPADNSQLSSSFGGSRGAPGSHANMIGDSTFGGSGVVAIQGVLSATLGHPTQSGAARLNIAENNSPFVRDRAAISYRHFHNASPAGVFSNSPQGLARNVHTDSMIVGIERRLTENTSLEVRLPVNWQFGSKAMLLQGNTPLGGPFNGSNNNFQSVLHDRDGEIGNLGLIVKRQLRRNDNVACSCGVGFNLPTAPDVRLQGRIQDTSFPMFEEDSQFSGSLLNLDVALDARYRNQTVNVQPFCSAIVTPTERMFLQGFLQLDVPVNQSEADLTILGTLNGNTLDSMTQRGMIGQQTLLRFNVGGGYWFYQSRGPRYPHAIGAMLELHYTTTLNDADVLQSPSQNLGDLDGDFNAETLDLAFGNMDNRVDSLNMTFGIPIRIGQLTIYNACIVPLRDAPNRGFDFEYALVIDRRL